MKNNGEEKAKEKSPQRRQYRQIHRLRNSDFKSRPRGAQNYRALHGIALRGYNPPTRIYIIVLFYDIVNIDTRKERHYGNGKNYVCGARNHCKCGNYCDFIKESRKGDEKMNFGENVRRLRVAKGITQEQLAEAIGITQMLKAMCFTI